MPFKIMYVTIKWKPGQVTFVRLKKIAVNDTPDHCQAIERANTLLNETAEKSSKTHFMQSVVEIKKDMYYEIYEDSSGTKMVHTSG